MIFGLKFRVIHLHVPTIQLSAKYTTELLISPRYLTVPRLHFICDCPSSQRYI